MKIFQVVRLNFFFTNLVRARGGLGCGMEKRPDESKWFVLKWYGHVLRMDEARVVNRLR